MTICNINTENFSSWLSMAADLWPDIPIADIEIIFRKELLSSRYKHFLAQHINGEYIGFINLSLRTDYVEGASSSPVGYIEGIYVKPAYRHQNIARALVEEGIAWSKNKGCTEIASDTP